MGGWYYIKHGVRYGPVTDSYLRRMLHSGQLQPNDWVWGPGMSTWSNAYHIRDSLITSKTPLEPPQQAVVIATRKYYILAALVKLLLIALGLLWIFLLIGKVAYDGFGYDPTDFFRVFSNDTVDIIALQQALGYRPEPRFIFYDDLILLGVSCVYGLGFLLHLIDRVIHPEEAFLSQAAPRNMLDSSLTLLVIAIIGIGMAVYFFWDPLAIQVESSLADLHGWSLGLLAVTLGSLAIHQWSLRKKEEVQATKAE